MFAAQFPPAEEYERIGDFYERLAEILRLPENVLTKVNEEKSGWSIAQHIFHVSRANARTWRGIERILAQKPPAEPGGEPHRLGQLLFRVGFIRRGTVQAPDFVRPEEQMPFEEARIWAGKSEAGYRSMSETAPTIPKDTYRIAHPLLGPLNAREWLSFIRIHSTHHLMIIDDILGTDPATP